VLADKRHHPPGRGTAWQASQDQSQGMSIAVSLSLARGAARASRRRWRAVSTADFLWQCWARKNSDHRAPRASIAAARLRRWRQPYSGEAALGADVLYRKGRDGIRAAPPETLRAALVGIERKRQQQMQISAGRSSSGTAISGRVPSRSGTVLYKPDFAAGGNQSARGGVRKDRHVHRRS